MSSFKKGGMYILSSPSGAGKTTLVKKISKNKNFWFQYLIQQDFLDPMKEMEKIIFTTKNNFKKLIKKGEFLEHARVLIIIMVHQKNYN